MRNKLFYTIFYLISLLPLWFLYLLSDFLYFVFYKMFSYRKNVVHQNLVKSFPNKTLEEIKKIEKNFYSHFCDIIVETIKSLSSSETFFRRHISFKNIEVFNKFNNDNKSIVLAVAHYGNWEWGLLGISIFAKQKMMGVYKKLNNKRFDQIMKKIRAKFGSELVPMQDTLRYLIKTKDECKIIGLLADQRPIKSDSNFFATFLNQETAVYLGPEKISKKMNLPILYCGMKKKQRGVYEIYIEELNTNSEITETGEITSLYLRKLEEKIIENPEYWLWTHKRWK